MATKKSPLALVKERFKDKKGLVEAVRALATKELFVERLDADKGLAHVSNAKLLHLHDVLSAVKKEFGSRDALLEAIVKLEKRTKDKTFRAGFEKKSTPALYDAYKAAKKRSAAASA